MSDIVNHPPHYRSGGIEAIDVIEAFDLNFRVGNAIKYLLRLGRKDAAITDAKKARWYIDREIAALEPPPEANSDLTTYPLVYLATPYSKYSFGLERAFEDAAALAATMLRIGIKIYSPIVHCHPVGRFGNLDPLDHSIWLPFDEAMMRASAALLIAHMPGWRESKGIAHEIDFFTRERKPIFDFVPETMVMTRRVSA